VYGSKIWDFVVVLLDLLMFDGGLKREEEEDEDWSFLIFF